MAREGLVIDDFSGGLNNVVDPSLIAENEVADLRNLLISRTGKLISRPPIQKVGTPPASDNLKALGYYRNEEGTVFLVVANHNKTYLYNLTANTWTEIWTSPADDMTTYANRLYLVNKTQGGGYWSKVSSTYQWTTVAAMPAGNQIHYTKGRIYVSSRAGGRTSTLRYSALSSTALGTTIDDWPVENYIDVNEGDGDELIKIQEGNNELFLFRSNSTYRLAYSASADPALGTLTVMSTNIGADCARSVVEYENTLAVLHAGTLYQFAGYNFYPYNPANKVQFKVRDGYTGIMKQGVSKVGQYLLVWHHGYMYCYDTETSLWSEWESDTKASHFIEAPRGTFLASSAVPTAYGTPSDDFVNKGIVKLALEYSTTSAETIRCQIITRTYDIGQPSLFKRLFGWEILAVVVNWIEGGLTPIDTFREIEEQLTWEELQTYTWSGAAAAQIMWLPLGAIEPVIVNQLPSSKPKPQVIKISGKQTFKRGFFTIRFQNDGTANTAPSRLDGIVLYLTNGRRMAMARSA